MERTRVALVGAGWWGAQHARALTEHPDVELCAVVDRQRDRAEARGRLYGTRVYDDIASMLEAEHPDFVNLCLPNNEHFEPTREVISSGYPLLVEKPLTIDLAEADLLIKEANRSNVFFAINFNHHYATAIELTRSAIESGSLGDIVFATWRFGGERDERSSIDHPFANLIETQCHGFDLLEYLCGPIASVSAEFTDTGAPGKRWQTLVLALRFTSGAVGSLLGT
ncbi:MAG TPA: Gfo/Idh/MocA family oxidoreductase [Acidimicrobiales bacterium]|nr:Gfo/Idh/MocA family oxidoreductase [Acidimicrobiales bacterium]